MRFTVLALLFVAAIIATARCGAPAPNGLRITVQTSVGQVDFLSVAVFDSKGVRARVDRLPTTGTATLPGQFALEVSERTSPLTVMVSGIKSSARVGFGSVTVPAGSDVGPFEVTLAAPGSDVDGDGVPDAIDRCHFIADADQLDSDADGSGDACACRENRFPTGEFKTAADLSRFSLEAASSSLVDAGSGTLAMRVCRTQSTGQFGATASMPFPGPATEIEFSMLIRGAGKAGPLLRQSSSSCDSWGSCNGGGLSDPAQLSADFAIQSTVLKTQATGGLEVEATSYDSAVGTCFDVKSICVVVKK